MIYSNAIPTPANPSSTPIRLEIKMMGHVPSFKNSKQMITGRGGRRPMLITKPERQKWMKDATASLESQLRSELAMRGIATTTGLTQLSKIASLLPLDDSRKWIPSHSVSTRLVSKGEEGASIVINKI